jgi:hypothetical protein
LAAALTLTPRPAALTLTLIITLTLILTPTPTSTLPARGQVMLWHRWGATPSQVFQFYYGIPAPLPATANTGGMIVATPPSWDAVSRCVNGTRTAQWLVRGHRPHPRACSHLHAGPFPSAALVAQPASVLAASSSAAHLKGAAAAYPAPPT